MAVIYRCQLGAFLHHYISTDQDQKHQKDELKSLGSIDTSVTPICYRWKEELISVNSPFMMDTQAERLRQEAEAVKEDKVKVETSAQRKRRKKLGKRPRLSEQEEKITEMISSILPILVTEGRKANCLKELPTALSCTDNNLEARAAAQIVGCADLFQTLCSEWEENGCCYDQSLEAEAVVLKEDNSGQFSSATSVIGRCICNLGDHYKILNVEDHSFIIPVQSTFLTSGFHHFIKDGFLKVKVKGGYDLIVIDPPWLNKSVKRKKSYDMVQASDLKLLPLYELAGQDSLICVWTTNNEKLLQFVREELFHHWSVSWVANWIWMKVTRYGESVCSIHSLHKKPYEQLIIGRYKGPGLKKNGIELNSGNDSITYPNVDQQHSSVGETETNEKQVFSVKVQDSQLNGRRWQERPLIPESYTIASVPCSLHSKKPPLAEVMLPYLPSSPRCLELFARNLTSGWTSWGNEPLRHQHLDYFEQSL